METNQKNTNNNLSYISVWLMPVFIILIVLAQQYSDTSIVILVLQILLAGSFFYSIYYLHKIIRKYTDNKYPISPIKAVLLNLVPLFNIYWFFKWTNEISLLVNSQNKQAKLPKWISGIIMTIALLIAIVFNSNNSPTGSLIAALIYSLLMFYIFRTIQKVFEIKWKVNLKAVIIVSGSIILLIAGLFAYSKLSESIAQKEYYKSMGIFEAIQYSPEAVKIVIENGTDINIRDEKGNTTLSVAFTNIFDDFTEYIKYAEPDELKKLTGFKDVYNYQDNPFAKEMYFEVFKDKLEIITMLINNGADVNARSIDEDNSKKYYGSEKIGIDRPIHKAVLLSNIELLKLLISQDADINVEDFYSKTALRMACESGDLEIVQLLLSEGAKQNSENGFWTALMSASEKGNAEIVKLLLANGAEINTMSYKNSYTSLMMAVRNEHVEVVEILLENNADVYLKTKDGYSALDYLNNPSGNSKIIALLQPYGSD